MYSIRSHVRAFEISSAQDGNKPVFSVADNLNEYGEWQSAKFVTIIGGEQTIAISQRHKVNKKFALTCKFTVELRDDSDKKITFYYLAGNSGTDYYAGKAGAIKEKVKLGPGETVEIDYPLPTANFKAQDDDEICKKCKELEHLFMFGDLEAKQKNIQLFGTLITRIVITLHFKLP